MIATTPTPPMRTRRDEILNARPGFALIVTISLLVLLAIVAVGLLGVLLRSYHRDAL